MSTTIYHTHHIIPKHAGGTNHPDNLVQLTVAEHAEAHRKLYEEHRRWQDKLAWHVLLGIIGKEEILLEKSSIGGLSNKGLPKSAKHRKAISESLTGKMQSSSIKKIISEKMMGNTNSKNHSSKQYKNIQSTALKKAWEKRKKSERVEGLAPSS